MNVKNLSRTATPVTQTIRAFGGGAAQTGKIDKTKSDTAYQHPTQGVIDDQLPRKGTMNDKIAQWIAGRWAVDRDDVLDNTHAKKYSVYNLFATQPL